MSFHVLKHTAILFLLALLMACEKQPQDTLFYRHDAAKQGIDFQNRLTEKPELNIFNYLYFYNGGGLAVADFDGNGFQDLYFTANQEDNKLYLNQGSFSFKEVTEAAGVAGLEGWTTGTTAVDINADGRMDIYVCMVSEVDAGEARNLLFINEGLNEEGIPTFREAAASYGLDFQGYSTQALFFDYDLDQDLDLYLLNHSVHGNGTFAKASSRVEAHPTSGDRLYENMGNGFRDVTEQSGIYSSVLGYGLGIAAGDVNLDGYPDIYVANDFHEDDYLYINQGNGTFKDMRPEAMGHTTRFSMGTDIADINNDGLPDILSLDMLPEDPKMLKASAAEDPYDVYQFKLNFGYNHQYARNAFQLNRGDGTFSQMSLYAGIAATDWSWAALMADFDADGLKDIVVSNGIKRRSNDMDYINYISNDAVQMRLEGTLDQKDMALIESLPIVKIPNYAYKNIDGLRFEDVSNEWGLGDDSFSNGTVYSDLDNDGDLDLVVNNIDQPVFLYENKSVDKNKAEKANLVKISAKGPNPNPRGLGVRLDAWVNGEQQQYELQAVRGYQSSLEPIAVVGLGEATQIDSLFAFWPGKGVFTQRNIPAGEYLKMSFDDFSAEKTMPSQKIQSTNIQEAFELGISFEHEENRFVEFNREPLIPHMTSSEGPAIAYADVNGDGVSDLFLGNAKRKVSELYFGERDGSYRISSQPAFEQDSIHEDVDALFFDADDDGDQDLFVVSGGSEWMDTSEYRTSRLYLNDGKGRFTRAELPKHYLNGSSVVAFNLDNDDDLDLLLAPRSKTWNYGQFADAFVLRNEGNGQFTLVDTSEISLLKSFGMITDMQVADLDQDRLDEIVIAREWQSIQVLEVRDGTLVIDEKLQANFEAYSGWWTSIYIQDVNGDGKLDVLAGNLGLNSRIKASEEEPVELFVYDYDGNGQEEQILTYYLLGERHLFATRDEITRQLPDIKKRYTKYVEFADAKLEDLFPSDTLSKAHHLRVNTFANAAFLSTDSTYRFHPLPSLLQLSSLHAFEALPMEGNTAMPIVAAGNFYDVNPQMGRYDADRGSIIQWNDETNDFEVIVPTLSLKGQVRELFEDQYGQLIFVRNNDKPLFAKKDALLRNE